MARRYLRAAAPFVVGLAIGGVLIFVQTHALQIFHDSCRYWHVPPPWAAFCPPSPRHGVNK